MLNKILALVFVGLLIGKFLFKPQLRAVKKWFDGVVNAMLIAIVLAYSLQIILWMTSGTTQ